MSKSSIPPKTKLPFKERSAIHFFLHDLGSELFPSLLKKARLKASIIKDLVLDPRELVVSKERRSALGPWGFLAFAIGAHWALGHMMGSSTDHGATFEPDAVEMQFRDFSPESRDSVRCNLLALAWITNLLTTESTYRWAMFVLFGVCSTLMTIYLRLRLRHIVELNTLTYGHYLVFATYCFGLCFLTSGVLQISSLLAPAVVDEHAGAASLLIALLSFVVLPIWHYGRLLRPWKVSSWRKLITIAPPYILLNMVGFFVTYLCACAYICDRM